ncbi:MAG: sigma-70 family RNA polymerase sigma factor [Pelosinus sp.]|nr:sigma-70 family RNA polymerase sigma factor [Pelosinus sp.]
MDILDFKPLVNKYTYSKTEDLKQIAWLAVICAFNDYNPAKGVPLPGYVESRVKYAVWNEAKKEQRHDNRIVTDSCLELLRDNADVSQTVEMLLLKEQVFRSLNALSIKQRQAIVKTIILGYSLTEYAREIRVTPQAVFNSKKKDY